MVQRMQETLYGTADAGDTLWDSGCRRHSIRQEIQETLYGTADAAVSLSDSGCSSFSIRQQMQETIYGIADAEDTLWDSRCITISIRQQMQDSLHQTTNAGVTVIRSDNRCKKANNGCRFLSHENYIHPELTQMTCILYLELSSIH